MALSKIIHIGTAINNNLRPSTRSPNSHCIVAVIVADDSSVTINGHLCAINGINRSIITRCTDSMTIQIKDNCVTIDFKAIRGSNILEKVNRAAISKCIIQICIVVAANTGLGISIQLHIRVIAGVAGVLQSNRDFRGVDSLYFRNSVAVDMGRNYRIAGSTGRTGRCFHSSSAGNSTAILCNTGSTQRHSQIRTIGIHRSIVAGHHGTVYRTAASDGHTIGLASNGIYCGCIIDIHHSASGLTRHRDAAHLGPTGNIQLRTFAIHRNLSHNGIARNIQLSCLAHKAGICHCTAGHAGRTSGNYQILDVAHDTDLVGYHQHNTIALTHGNTVSIGIYADGLIQNRHHRSTIDIILRQETSSAYTTHGPHVCQGINITLCPVRYLCAIYKSDAGGADRLDAQRPCKGGKQLLTSQLSGRAHRVVTGTGKNAGSNTLGNITVIGAVGIQICILAYIRLSCQMQEADKHPGGLFPGHGFVGGKGTVLPSLCHTGLDPSVNSRLAPMVLDVVILVSSQGCGYCRYQHDNYKNKCNYLFSHDFLPSFNL